jgi:hypothetical protein
LFHLRQQFVEARAGVHLSGEVVHLALAELAAEDIGHQPFDAAADVANLESQRRESMRPRPNLLGGETFGPLAQILARLLK